MTDVVIVSAVRSPIGRRGGGLAGLHPVDLLAAIQKACIDRADIAPEIVDQVIGGCVTTVGEQSVNITRTAWVAAGLPPEVGSTTIDAQCGSGQQSVNFGAALIASGNAEVVMACGVESMSRIGLGSNMRGPGRKITQSYLDRFENTSQFEGAERIATRWNIDRAATDAFGLRSQELAAAAWAGGAFDSEVVPVKAPTLADLPKTDPKYKDYIHRDLTGEFHEVGRDEGLRGTTAAALSALSAIHGEHGVHTAGSASQISDGAAAVLLMSAERAEREGLEPLGRIVGQVLVGSDPELMLTGPIGATRKVLGRTGLTLEQLDTVEINEAFASVVLAWQRELAVPETVFDRTNPLGGAIALGHPVGATGARLVATALHTLRRRGGGHGLVTMCCGGGLGTGTVLAVG